MADRRDSTRREFVAGAVALGAGVALTGCGKSEKGEKMEISPAEDLMREHGVLKRVLLAYAEAARRLEGAEDVSPDAIRDAATVIQTFIEGYHEKLEEDHLFPRFRKANVLVDLVDVLAAQHEAGRALTRRTVELATAQAVREAGSRGRLAQALRAYVRMYGPHEAREDTVLFPALKKVVSPHEYDAMGEEFEDKEHQLFGEDGFEKYVEKVVAIEKTLGIHDLAAFTPR